MDRSNNAGMVKYSLYPGRWFRLLTMREATLLMGYSKEEYEIIKRQGFSYRKTNKLVGNSIVVNILVAVFNVMFKAKGEKK